MGGGKWGSFVGRGGRQELCCRGRKKGLRSLVKGDVGGGSFVEEGGRQELFCRGKRKLWMSLVDRGGRRELFL